MSRFGTLVDSINYFYEGLATAFSHLKTVSQFIENEVVMWSSHIMDYPAHWLLIAHNSSNNKRTKRRN